MHDEMDWCELHGHDFRTEVLEVEESLKQREFIEADMSDFTDWLMDQWGASDFMGLVEGYMKERAEEYKDWMRGA